MNKLPINSQPASLRREERTSTSTTINPGTGTSDGAAPATAPGAADGAVPATATAAPGHGLIKLGIDAHAGFFMVARQVDHAVAQPPQKFEREALLKFIAKQKAMAGRVVCCYEAGCFGYGLHRQIVALGAENLVIAPQDWDERKTGVKTDRTDATAMLSRLDRYLAGNRKALAVVRVPGEAEEVARSRIRQRKQFQSDRNRWANQGKSLLLQYGLNLGWNWWRADRYEKTQAAVRGQLAAPQAEMIVTMLGDYQELVLKTGEKLDALTREQKQKVREDRAAAAKASAMKAAAAKDDAKTGDRTVANDGANVNAKVSLAGLHIKGIGELSVAQINAEIGDWHRFSNRRQVSSYTGLCPGVSGSGGKFTGLSITKHGNQRLRSALVELAWLIVRYQPLYPPAKQCRAVLDGTNRSAKKKAIVAVARKLAVDLWRIETGKCTPQKLGLALADAA